ncbi:MAG: DUF4870 domain-containing protein [Lachnospiraceae bacterium]|nr:DUF4870 domain-containing protein [Lachnospiraceae bacterium]
MDMNELMKSDDYTSSYDVQDINANKTMGILAYFGLLVLVPIFTARQSRFAMFHAEQGITLCIGCHIIGILAVVLGLIPAVGWVFSLIFGLVGILFLVLMILGIINAANGQAKELPVLGKLKIVKLQ